MMLPRTKPWTDDEDLRLKELWSAGLTNSAIGEVIGRSRNAISGRRYRLELPERPSPITYKVCAASVATGRDCRSDGRADDAQAIGAQC